MSGCEAQSSRQAELIKCNAPSDSTLPSHNSKHNLTQKGILRCYSVPGPFLSASNALADEWETLRATHLAVFGVVRHRVRPRVLAVDVAQVEVAAGQAGERYAAAVVIDVQQRALLAFDHRRGQACADAAKEAVPIMESSAYDCC